MKQSLQEKNVPIWQPVGASFESRLLHEAKMSQEAALLQNLTKIEKSLLKTHLH